MDPRPGHLQNHKVTKAQRAKARQMLHVKRASRKRKGWR